MWTLCVSHGVAADWERNWEQMPDPSPDPRPARAPQKAMAKPRAACDGDEGASRSWDGGAKVRGHQHHWPLPDMTSYDELLLRGSRTLTHNRGWRCGVRVVVSLHPSSLFAKGKKAIVLAKA